MTKTMTKTVITFVIAAAMFAAMTANAFACVNMPTQRCSAEFNAEFNAAEDAGLHPINFASSYLIPGASLYTVMLAMEKNGYSDAAQELLNIYDADYPDIIHTTVNGHLAFHCFLDNGRPVTFSREEIALALYRAATLCGWDGYDDATTVTIVDIDQCSSEETKIAVQFVMDNNLMDWPYEYHNEPTNHVSYFERTDGNFEPQSHDIGTEEIIIVSYRLYQALQNGSVRPSTAEPTQETKAEEPSSSDSAPAAAANNTNQADGSIRVLLNGSPLAFEQAPYTENGTTLVPMRVIFEALGVDVDYDNATQKITATKGETVIELTLGQKTAKKNGQTITLDVAATTQNGSTMVPLRFVAEALQANVDWDNDTQTIIITN